MNIFKTKSFWILSVFATALIFAAMFHLGDIYQSEADILLSSKDPQTEKNLSGVIENVGPISKTLTFYNNVLKFNPDIKDQAANLSDSNRKKYWDGTIQTQRLSSSHAIKLTVKGINKSESEALLKASSLELGWEINKYYGPDNKIDAAIIDGPITILGKKYNYSVLLAASASLSFFAVYFSYVISGLFKKRPKKKNSRLPLLSPEESKERLEKLLEGRV